MLHVFVFSLVLCTFQLLQGTTALFTLCTFLFTIMAGKAFNVAGGLTRPSGGFIFAFTILAALFGIVYKVVLDQPGQSNLTQPDRTIEVYVGTIFSMLIATFLSKKLRFKARFFPRFKSDGDLYRSAVGSLVVGGIVSVYSLARTTEVAAGSAVGLLLQLNRFLPLAIILGVMYEVRKTGGRKSTNLPVLLACIISFAIGVIGFSKEGMFTPLVAWIFPAAAGRYKVSVLQLFGFAIVFTLGVTYLVPYSQYGRQFRREGDPLSATLKTNLMLLSNLGSLRQLNSAAAVADEEQGFYYFQTPQGFADRLQMLGPDDALINTTENGAVFGLFPTLFYFENVVPHFIWPAKPILSFGNIYAHEVGILTNDEDTTTGISFSPGGEAYHQAKWVGILVVLPLILTMYFAVMDSLGGDTRKSPFALLMLVSCLHTAPEGGVGGIINGTLVGSILFFTVAFVAARIMPLLADLVMGPAKDPMLNRRVRPMAVPGRYVPSVDLSLESEQASS